ncbi:MAG TPA: hypothetical protein VFF04_00230 [Candidatus Babeliales bacterium]|nr:hypothetical protein [Candidatus Babeliales bacterium]
MHYAQLLFKFLLLAVGIIGVYAYFGISAALIMGFIGLILVFYFMVGAAAPRDEIALQLFERRDNQWHLSFYPVKNLKSVVVDEHGSFLQVDADPGNIEIFMHGSGEFNVYIEEYRELKEQGVWDLAVIENLGAEKLDLKHAHLKYDKMAQLLEVAIPITKREHLKPLSVTRV